MAVRFNNNMRQPDGANPRKRNYEKSSTHWIGGCWHLSHGSKIHIIFLGVRFNNNMSQPDSAHPRKLNYENFLPVEYPLDSGCWHLSNGFRIHIISPRVPINNNMSQANSTHPRKLNCEKMTSHWIGGC